MTNQLSPEDCKFLDSERMASERLKIAHELRSLSKKMEKLGQKMIDTDPTGLIGQKGVEMMAASGYAAGWAKGIEDTVFTKIDLP